MYQLYLTRIFWVLLCSLLMQNMAYAQTSPLSFEHPLKKGLKKYPYNDSIKQGVVPTLSTIKRSTRPPGTSHAIVQPAVYAASSNTGISENEQVIRDSRTGLPIFIKKLDVQGLRGKLNSQAAVATASRAFLTQIQHLLPQKSPVEEWNLIEFHSDELGHTHVRMNQTYKGLPINGQEVKLHFRPDGTSMLNGRMSPTPRIRTINPNLTQDEAIELVKEDLSRETIVKSFTPTQQKRLRYTAPQAKLVIYTPLERPEYHRLAYEIEIRPNTSGHWFYFIDAQNGEVLSKHNHVCSFKPSYNIAMPPVNASGQDLNGDNQNFSSYQVGANSFLLVDATKNMFSGQSGAIQNGDGLIITFDHDNDIDLDEISPVGSNNNTWDQIAVSAHTNASICYDYYERTFGRVSIDGEGVDIQSFINVPDEENRPLDNAFWNGIGIFYGNGNQAFSELAGALDVAAHEMTHGVISATANLVYQDESGALNESFADVFAVLIERRNFLIGEDVVNPQVFASGALRNLLDPNNGGTSLNDPGYQPASVSEQYRGTENNGGVHINSGIPNRAFALLLQELGNNQEGIEKAERIYYRALTEYLIRSSQFVDARLAVVQSAADLYGQTEADAARTAFDAVGILDPSEGGEQETDPFVEFEANTGQDFMLVVNTNVGFFESDYIYRYEPDNPGADALLPIGQNEPRNPISVSDNGTVGVYVDTQNRMWALINIHTDNPSEVLIDSAAVWENAVISKDGLRIAAISNQMDTSIYVFDLESDRGVRYPLFNPTTGQGITTADVLFADAMEWDYSGRFVMYDAFNLVSDAEQFTEAFYDIGFIEAWDPENQDFGSGNIIKLFSSLPEGVSIGNAVFAKNSPFIIAFDLIDDEGTDDFFDDSYRIMGRNIETGDMNILVETEDIGFPSFAPLDDALAFTNLNEEDRSIVSVLSLGGNKIESTGVTEGLLIDGKWPVWYAVGQRNVATSTQAELAPDKDEWEVYPNPVDEQLTIRYTLDHDNEIQIELYDLLGARLNLQMPRLSSQPGTHEFTVPVGSLNPGMYIIKWNLNDKSYVKRWIKR